jgi:hypothetical protein
MPLPMPLPMLLPLHLRMAHIHTVHRVYRVHRVSMVQVSVLAVLATVLATVLQVAPRFSWTTTLALRISGCPKKAQVQVQVLGLVVLV